MLRARTLTAVVAPAVLALSLFGCGGGTSSSTSDSSDSDPAACPNGKVRFGVEPYEDPAKLTPAYQALTEALTKKLGCPVELKIVENYSAEVLAMRNKQLELAEFGPLGFVFAVQQANAEPLASFADGSGQLTTYKAGIWVPKDSPVQTVADLKGRTLALSSPGSTSGDALPRYALQKEGIAQTDLKVNYAGGHPQSLLALVNGKVDAAEINTQEQAVAVAAGTFKPADFRQIWQSDPIPNDPVTVDGKLPKAFKDRVAKALLELDKADVEKVGAFLDVDPPGPLVAVTKETYQPLFDLASALKLTEKDV